MWSYFRSRPPISDYQRSLYGKSRLTWIKKSLAAILRTGPRRAGSVAPFILFAASLSNFFVLKKVKLVPIQNYLHKRPHPHIITGQISPRDRFRRRANQMFISRCISLPGFYSAFSIASTHLNLVMPTSGLTHRPILRSLVTTDCKLRQPGGSESTAAGGLSITAYIRFNRRKLIIV